MKEYRSCCYSNAAKVNRVKTLDTYRPLIQPRMTTKVQRPLSLSMFTAVLGSTFYVYSSTVCGCLTTPYKFHQWKYLVQQFLLKTTFAGIDHDHIRNFFLFKNQMLLQRNKISRRRGDLRECIKAAARHPPKSEFQECYPQEKQCWIKCATSEGVYFEGN